MRCRKGSHPLTPIVLPRWIARVWSIASFALIPAFFVGEGLTPAQAGLVADVQLDRANAPVSGRWAPSPCTGRGLG